jgi:hypothetical protein
MQLLQSQQHVEKRGNLAVILFSHLHTTDPFGEIFPALRHVGEFSMMNLYVVMNERWKNIF